MYQSVRERLLSIGARAANLLAAYDDLYQSFERMKGLFFDELPFSIQFVRIYVMDEESQGMREEVCYFYDSIQQGHDFIPLYQLPAQLIREKRITPAHGGYNPSKLIPLHVSGSLVGMLEIGTNEAFDEEHIGILEKQALGQLQIFLYGFDFIGIFRQFNDRIQVNLELEFSQVEKA